MLNSDACFLMVILKQLFKFKLYYFYYSISFMATRHPYILLFFLAVFMTIALCQEDEHEHEHEEEEHHEETELLNESQIWGFGFLAGFAISLIGFLAALILLCAKRCCSSTKFDVILKFLFSLACGALLGDSIIHILAHSYQNQEMNSLITSAILICSILLFLLIQRILESFGVAHHHWVGEEQEHSHQNPEVENQFNKIEPRNSKTILVQAINDTPANEEMNQESQNQGENCCSKCCKTYSGKGSAGYTNLIGSLIHNFIDGLTLGIAFATGNPIQIIPVIIAIIAHEIPRQLGDVAILLKSNFNQVQTVICNGTINMISLVGVIIGLAVVNLTEVVQNYILVFVAGNFLYIGADIWRNMFKNKGDDKKCKNFIEFIGFGVGVGAMFALVLLEEEEHNH